MSAEEDIMMNLPLYAAKQQLRAVIKQRLALLSSEAILDQSRTIFHSLQGFKPYQDAQSVSIFLSMPAAEVQTDAIVKHALSAGKQVYVPYLHKNPVPSPDTPARVMDMVRLRDVPDYESLKRDKWGIPSIDPGTVHERRRILGGPDAHKSDQATLDLILMPGVAFDIDPENGGVRRLGHGKGFYDYFLHRYALKASSLQPPASRILLYGLGLTEQYLSESADESVPVGPYDQPLDGLLLGNGDVKTVPPPEVD